MVIDAHSPVLWGSAHPPAPERSDASSVALVEVSERDLGSAPPPDQDLDEDADGEAARGRDEELSALAVARVRAQPAIVSLHKGGRLHSVVSDPDVGWVAHSFAGIYVLVLVYAGSAAEPFDELRAERSVAEALPRIERLVLALPPRDPPPAPVAGVIALRGRRRRP